MMIIEHDDDGGGVFGAFGITVSLVKMSKKYIEMVLMMTMTMSMTRLG